MPLHKGRGSSPSSFPSGTVTALNAANYQRVDRAEYTVSGHADQVEIELGAYNEAAGGDTAAIDEMVLEIQGKVSDLKHDIERQFYSNGDALIAQCTTTSGSATINLLNTGYGYDALLREWLVPGEVIDIGTTASEAAVVADAVITDVSVDATTPTITINSAVTTSSSHYVSIANARAGTTSYESPGLRNITATTGALGGLNPATAGEGFWKGGPGQTETTLSLPGLLTMVRGIKQKNGPKRLMLITSLKQEQAFYELLQNQVRFTTDKVEAGNVEKAVFGGAEIWADPNCPDREAYVIDPNVLAIVTGAKIKAPRWASEIGGDASTAGLIWRQGYNSFVDGLFFPCSLATRKRNAGTQNISLTT